MPTTLRAILEKLQEDTYKCDPNDIDTALLAIQKWAEEKVPAKEKIHPSQAGQEVEIGFNQCVDETLANIRSGK